MNCSPASGATFGVGTTTVACTATDASGNSSNGSFTVTVLGAKEQLTNLIKKIVDVSLRPPAVGRLIANFNPNDPVQRQIVCNSLRTFVVLVQANRRIPPAQAADLDRGRDPNSRTARLLGSPRRQRAASGTAARFSLPSYIASLLYSRV